MVTSPPLSVVADREEMYHGNPDSPLAREILQLARQRQDFDERLSKLPRDIHDKIMDMEATITGWEGWKTVDTRCECRNQGCIYHAEDIVCTSCDKSMCYMHTVPHTAISSEDYRNATADSRYGEWKLVCICTYCYSPPPSPFSDQNSDIDDD